MQAERKFEDISVSETTTPSQASEAPKSPAPSQAEVMQQIMSNPADAVEIGSQLPAIQRARISQFCYGRVHMRELGLRLASTCDLMTLKAAFGRGGEVVFEQSRNVDKTLGELKSSAGSRSPRPITLMGSIKG